MNADKNLRSYFLDMSTLSRVRIRYSYSDSPGYFYAPEWDR
jgi:hypothetical protein